MNTKPKHRVNGKFAKKTITESMNIEVLQQQILDGYNDVEQITEAFNYLYPDRKHELLSYPYKRKMVFLFGKYN